MSDEPTRTAARCGTNDCEYEAEITDGVEYGTDRPCQIGRLTYVVGAHPAVALAYRLTDPETPWRLTWVGYEGKDAVRLPDGLVPADGMLAALARAAVARAGTEER